MKIALVGNPNVGKSAIFGALTGSYVIVSNYPGTTVEVAKGTGRFSGERIEVIDTPGVNSLTPNSEDERVTLDILSKSDIGCIVQVADSKNLKRSLHLTIELLELGMPLVLDLNMADESRERGIKIDPKKLSELVGIEVVETIAVTKEGVSKLKQAIVRSRTACSRTDAKSDRTACQKGDYIGRYKIRAKAIDDLASSVLTVSKPLKKNIAETIGAVTTNPLTGIPILFLILGVLYLFVGKFAAGTVVNFLENRVFEGFINPFFKNAAARYIPWEFIKDMLVGKYGIITMAFTYAISIILPIITAFFIFFGFLEDSGYLPRLSVLSDRVFKSIGLNGRAILPIVLGLGCGTMATLTTRILDTKKERILVTLLLTLAIPCSAQLGIILGILGSLSFNALLIWLGTILGVLILVGWAASKILPGERSPFIQEVPPIRMPQLQNIITKTLARLKWYLKEAVPLFILGTLVLFLLDRSGILGRIQEILNPIMMNFLNLPAQVTEAFIIGFFRRDYGAAGLYVLARTGALDRIQLVVAIIVITLFIPCIAQFLVTIKERGIKTACIIGSFVFVFAFFVGGVMNFLIRYLQSLGIVLV